MFGEKQQSDEFEEQALIVSFDVDESDYSEAQKQISKLTDDLEESLAEIKTEYDGDEYGDDECNLYFYGPDAEKIYNLVSVRLKVLPWRPLRFKLRFGDVKNLKAREKTRIIVERN